MGDFFTIDFLLYKWAICNTRPLRLNRTPSCYSIIKTCKLRGFEILAYELATYDRPAGQSIDNSTPFYVELALGRYTTDVSLSMMMSSDHKHNCSASTCYMYYTSISLLAKSVLLYFYEVRLET